MGHVFASYDRPVKDHRPAAFRALDLVAICKSGAQLDGHWPLAGLPRLSASLAAPSDDSVHWSAQAMLKAVSGAEAQRWLHLAAQVRVPLVCQRCLGVLVQSVEVDRRIRFVRGEQEAARLDEESDDDVLSLPARLDLIELLEDELILALPLVPKHAEDCPQPLQSSAQPDGALPPSVQPPPAAAPHPFAALASLRKTS